MVARLFRFEHKPKFPENRRVDPHFDGSCRHPHHSKPVGDHLASQFFENKRQLIKLPIHTKEQHSRTEMLKNYRDENGQPLDPTKLDLEDLQVKNALPSDLGQGFSLYVNVITQALPPVPNAQVALAPGDTINVAMNTIQLGGTDWNDAVEAYNTRRAQIKSEIVTRVSAYFGFDLLLTFPYYQCGNAGKSIQNPLATP
jgi:hypothetical protein